MIYGSNQNETVTGIEALSVVVPNVSAEEMYTVKVEAVNSAGSSPAAVASASECSAGDDIVEAHSYLDWYQRRIDEQQHNC